MPNPSTSKLATGIVVRDWTLSYLYIDIVCERNYGVLFILVWK